MKDEALKLALSCIKSSVEYKRGNATFVEAAEDVERALAAPVQNGGVGGCAMCGAAYEDQVIKAPVQSAERGEPVAWVREHELPLAPGDAFSWVETFVHKTPLYMHPAPAAPVQEPWGACVYGRVFVGKLPEHARKFSEDEGVPIQWLYTTPPAAPAPEERKRKWVGLTDEQIDLFINGRGDEDDDDYVEPTGDGFGITDADLVKLVRRTEAKLKEKNSD
jgi:hypothetical protein